MLIRKQENRQVRRAGFTLMEMLVVVAIIVALAGMGGYYFIGALNDSKIDSARTQARTITQALESFYRDNSQYPAALSDLLQQNPMNGKGPYLKSVDAIRDPWGREFQYDPSGFHNREHGAVVIIPDVFCDLGDNRIVGNWK